MPVYAIADNIQTGTNIDRRPQESLWFLLNQGFSSLQSTEQTVKAEAGVERQESEGALAGEGSSLFPFAVRDPLAVLLDNEYLLNQTKGATKLKNLIETQTMPNGMKAVSVAGLRTKLKELRSNLSAQQFDEWLEFRTMMRNWLIELDADGWTGRLNISKGSKENYYPARALLRMAGLYLVRPHEFRQPSKDYLEDVVANFTQYLSDKDKLRRGKR